MDLDRLIPEATAFLTRLAADNSRDVWEAHKAEYQTRLKAPAEALLAALCPEIAALTGHEVTTKLFRPNRDLRFSRDKTPYHTHLHMAWMLKAGGRQDPGYIFGIDPAGVTLGLCVFDFAPQVLADWRRMVDLDGDRIGAVLAAAESQGYALNAPSLKRVPPPHAQDHPQGRLLRMTGLMVTRAADPAQPLLPQLRAAFADLLPVERLFGGFL